MKLHRNSSLEHRRHEIVIPFGYPRRSMKPRHNLSPQFKRRIAWVSQFLSGFPVSWRSPIAIRFCVSGHSVKPNRNSFFCLRILHEAKSQFIFASPDTPGSKIVIHFGLPETPGSEIAIHFGLPETPGSKIAIHFWLSEAPETQIAIHFWLPEASEMQIAIHFWLPGASKTQIVIHFSLH